MSTSRRNFLRMAAITAAAAGVGVPAIVFVANRERDAATIASLDTSSLTLLPPEQTFDVLTAMAEALFSAYTIDAAGYRSFYSWRAENLPGYRETYQNFVAVLNQNVDYATAPLTTRRDLLAPGLHLLRTEFQPTEPIPAGWDVFTQDVIFETIDLFIRRDAWRALGYTGWPGMSRGLEAYRQPFGSTGSE